MEMLRLAFIYINHAGSNNTALGFQAGVNSSNLINTTAIGYNAKVNNSYTIQ